MASLLTTAADVGAALDTTDETIQGLDAVFTTQCPSLSAATLAQWQAFKTSWVGFVVQTESQIYHVPLTGQAFATFNPYSAMTSIEGFQATVLQWQGIARTSCSAAGPDVTPPPTPDPAWLTALKWGGGTLVVLGTLFTVAPLIEDVVGSAAVARSAGATRRLLTRKKKENPVSGAVEVGTIGDVNYLEYGGGPVLRTEHGYAVEWVEPPPDEIDFDSKRARWTVYRVDLDQEVPTLLDVDAAAETSGMSARALRQQFLSNDPMTRASAYWTLASHYGWYELDQYPLSLKKAEVYRRYGEEIHTENPNGRRRR